jgi:hypothetical protein
MSDRVFLATKTNVGIDIDNKPPTAELSIARRELNIQPVFPDYTNEDSIMPTFAAFGLSDTWINPRIRGEFAGGKAAVEALKPEANTIKLVDQNEEQELETEPKESDNKVTKDDTGSDSIVCIQKMPEKTFWRKFLDGITGENDATAKPFFFATDTAYGLKVMWSGTAGPYPDSLKLGYNRKEYASAPIFIEKNTMIKNKKQGDGKPISREKNDCNGEDFTVRMPSFYASIDNSSGLEKITDNQISPSTTHTQFFATGQAAYEYSKNGLSKNKLKNLLHGDDNDQGKTKK